MGARSFVALGALVAALALGSAALGQRMGGGTGPESAWSPAACSGHGHTEFGSCQCDPGWAGAGCDNGGTSLDCGEHGRASNGWCVCDAGWKGRTCQTAPLICTHGKAVHGKCACEAGWSGAACDKGQPA